MSKSRGHARHEEHEEHEEHVNHEAWVIPYADMLTLLMALFLVLFAVGRTDLEKFKKLAESFRSEFGGNSSKAVSLGGTGEEIVGSGGGGILSGDASAESTSTTMSPADQALAEKDAATAAAQDAVDSLEGVESAVQQAADIAGIGEQVGLTIDARGLIVTIVTDQVLFDSGSADLQSDGVSILDIVAQALATVPNNISVEGHTDSVPVSNTRYRNNWDLSNGRASSVLQFMLAAGIAPERLSSTGHADTMPVGDNTTAEGRAANRRVEIIVKADVSLDPVLSTTTTAVVDPTITAGATPDDVYGEPTVDTAVASEAPPGDSGNGAPATSTPPTTPTQTTIAIPGIIPDIGPVNGTPKGGTEQAGSGL